MLADLFATYVKGSYWDKHTLRLNFFAKDGFRCPKITYLQSFPYTFFYVAPLKSLYFYKTNSESPYQNLSNVLLNKNFLPYLIF